MYDVVIIGAGACGSAIARELSKFKVNACVIERDEDVCCGTTKANSAIVHAGFDAIPGTLKAKVNVEGNKMMGELAKELDFPFKRNGSLVVCLEEEGLPKLMELKDRADKNGVPDVCILDGVGVKAIEPNVSDDVVAALYAPTGGIVCPFTMNIAMAENAAVNGVEFKFNTEVTIWLVKTKSKLLPEKANIVFLIKQQAIMLYIQFSSFQMRWVKAFS